LLFQVPAFAPVSDSPAAGFGKDIVDDPEDDDGPKVWERVFYRGAEQAADGNEKENKK
jgi:hypothetical protein